MQGNSNFERKRNNRNQRPPAGEQREPKPAQQRVRQWTRENNKRDQWQTFGTEF